MAAHSSDVVNQSVLPRRARDVRGGAESSCNFWRVPVPTGKRTRCWVSNSGPRACEGFRASTKGLGSKGERRETLRMRGGEIRIGRTGDLRPGLEH